MKLVNPSVSKQQPKSESSWITDENYDEANENQFNEPLWSDSSLYASPRVAAGPEVSNVGRLKVTVEYDEAEQFLDVCIHEAEKLPMTKKNKLPNAYAKIKFDPNEGFKLNTKVVSKTSEPVWDESLEVDLECVPEDEDLLMVIEVWNKDFMKSSYIGSLVFPMDVVQKNVVNGWFDLTESYDITDLQSMEAEEVYQNDNPEPRRTRISKLQTQPMEMSAAEEPTESSFGPLKDLPGLESIQENEKISSTQLNSTSFKRPLKATSSFEFESKSDSPSNVENELTRLSLSLVNSIKANESFNNYNAAGENVVSAYKEQIENEFDSSDVELEPSPSKKRLLASEYYAQRDEFEDEFRISKNMVTSTLQQSDIFPSDDDLRSVGRLKLIIKYDEADQFLDVFIDRAEKLPDTKKNKEPNAYVKIKFDPGNKKIKFTSKVVNKTAEPVWQETFEIDLECITIPEDQDLSIVVEVWSKEFLKSTYIGSLVFPMDIVQKNLVDGWFDLTESFSHTDLRSDLKKMACQILSAKFNTVINGLL